MKINLFTPLDIKNCHHTHNIEIFSLDIIKYYPGKYLKNIIYCFLSLKNIKNYSLVATKVYFNSVWNMNSFLNSIQSYLAIQPSDQQHKYLAEKIRHKCEVLYFPIELPVYAMNLKGKKEETIIHIVWPHRWFV